MRQSRLPFEAARFQAKRILVDGQVGLGDLRPGFAAGGCGATAILVIKRRGWPPLIGNVLSACRFGGHANPLCHTPPVEDRKSTRLNSSHGYISYAVFCLKKKNSLSSTAVNFKVSFWSCSVFLLHLAVNLSLC